MDPAKNNIDSQPIQLIIPSNFPIILELFYYATKVYYSQNYAGIIWQGLSFAMCTVCVAICYVYSVCGHLLCVQCVWPFAMCTVCVVICYVCSVCGHLLCVQCAGSFAMDPSDMINLQQTYKESGWNSEIYLDPPKGGLA